MKKRYFNIQHNSHKKQFCTKAVLAGIFSVLVFFSSCSNAFLDGGSSSGVKTGTVTGSIDFGGALPKEILDQLNSSSNNGPQGERTAFPSIPSSSNCTLQVYAQIGSDDSTKIVAITNPSTKTFELSDLKFGKEYTITALLNNTSGNVIMQGSEKITLSESNPVAAKNVSVAPMQTAEGFGTVKLEFSVENEVGWNGSNVQYYYAIDTNEEQPDGYFPSNGSFDIPGNTFTSGVHTIKVIFKKKGTNYILYTFTETVNVFDNLTTNTWVKNGDEPYLTTNGGTTKCIITKECVDKFAQKTFYVDSSRQTTNSSASNYTTESGTYFNPFVKVSDAVNRINAGSDADYTIYVKDGTKEENITTNLNIKNNVNIETYKNSVGDGLGNATLEYATIGKLTNAVAISANKVSITGIKFLNTSDSNTEKTGISVSSSSSLTMKRCTVEGFTQDKRSCFAGGILILSDASVDITDCVISKNTGYQGGGIYNKGTLTLTDCTISGNTATDNGGGIYNTGTLTFSGNCLIGEATKNPIQNPSDFSNRAAGTGGGIYTTKPFTVKNGNTLKVYGNIALSYGGGIQIELSEEGSITGLDVQNCYAQGDSSYGGGISIMRDNVKFTLSSSNIKNCKATIGGGVYDCTTNSSTYLNFDKNEITECSATEKGGGLYLSSDSKCNLKDTKISGCSSVEQGGGIFMEFLTELDIQNGSVITDNTGTAGAGIYVFSNIEDSGSKVIFSGSGYVDKANDLYLNDLSQITIDSPLSLPDEAGGVAATITPNTYNENTTVLSGSAVATEYAKFKLTPKEGEIWHIGSDGKLFSAIGTKKAGTGYAVGDIVFNDGSATPYSEIAARNSKKCEEYEKAAAIAVIYKVESSTAYGVGIKHASGLAWCIETAEAYSNQDLSAIKDDTNGVTILKKMIDAGVEDIGVKCYTNGSIMFGMFEYQNKFKTNYPAFEFAYYYGQNDGHNTEGDYKKGWYLPTVSELQDIFQEFTITDNALKAAGGDGFIYENYWSSNQHEDLNAAKGIRIDNQDNVYGIDKKSTASACAIRVFTW